MICEVFDPNDPEIKFESYDRTEPRHLESKQASS